MKHNRKENELYPRYRRFIPQWRLRVAFGILLGLLVGIRSGIQIVNKESKFDLLDEYVTARPFKVPGPSSLCPAFKNEDKRRIIFIESSGQECLTPRQACGVEAAARMNPNMEVKVYVNIDKFGPTYGDDQLIRPGRVRSCSFNSMLASRFPNIDSIRLNLTQMIVEEPRFASLFESGKLQESQWPVVHISDAVRLLLLEKYGGIYLDFDNIVFRPLHCLRNTFSYLDGLPIIENGVLVMDAQHPFLKFLIRYLVQVYDAKLRTILGPPSFGKAFQLFCEVSHPFKSGLYHCHNNATLTLMHPDGFFPVKHDQNQYFYSNNLEGYDLQAMERAYLTHVYLSSWGTTVHYDSLYARMARQYCPSVWNFTHTEALPLGF